VPNGYFIDWPAREERLEQAPAHFAVQTAYPVDGAAAPDRQVRHVERFRRVVRVLAAQGQQLAPRYPEPLLRVTT